MKTDDVPPLVPRLRFPEFRSHEPWVAKQLHEISDRVTETVGDTSLTPVSISAGKGFVPQAEKFGRDISGAQYSKYIRLRRGELAYNRGNSKRFPQGCVYQLTEFDEAAASNAFHCFRLHDHVEPAFVLGFFEDNGHGRQLIRHITSGARSNGLLSIGAETFYGITVPLPPTSAEQQKISDFLGSLDDLITAESQKLDALRQHKQGLMQVLFAVPGEVLPLLRFPEFQNAEKWRPRKLGKLVQFRSGGTPSKSNPAFWKGSTPWVSAKDMKHMYLADTEDHITQEAMDNGAKLVPAGTVLMLTRGMTLRNDVPICVLRRDMSFNQDVKALRPKADVHELFLAFVLQANKQALLKMVDIAGHGTSKLNTDELEEFELVLPKPDEQKRIALFLSLLDEMQIAQSNKVRELKLHKQGLLQQLFPALEGDKQ